MANPDLLVALPPHQEKCFGGKALSAKADGHRHACSFYKRSKYGLAASDDKRSCPVSAHLHGFPDGILIQVLMTIGVGADEKYGQRTS